MHDVVFNPYPIRDGSAVSTDIAGREYYLHLAATSDSENRLGFAFGISDSQLTPKVPIHESVFVPTSTAGYPAEGIIRVQQPAQLTERHMEALGSLAQGLGIGWGYGLDENQFLRTVEVEPAEHDIALADSTGEPIYFMHVPSLPVVLASLRALALQSVYAQN